MFENELEDQLKRNEPPWDLNKEIRIILESY
jgi:hypothetical protein